MKKSYTQLISSLLVASILSSPSFATTPMTIEKSDNPGNQIIIGNIPETDQWVNSYDGAILSVFQERGELHGTVTKKSAHVAQKNVDQAPIGSFFGRILFVTTQLADKTIDYVIKISKDPKEFLREERLISSKLVNLVQKTLSAYSAEKHVKTTLLVSYLSAQSISIPNYGKVLATLMTKASGKSLRSLTQFVYDPNTVPPSEQEMIALGRTIGEQMGNTVLASYEKNKTFLKHGDISSTNFMYDPEAGQLIWIDLANMNQCPYGVNQPSLCNTSMSETTLLLETMNALVNFDLSDLCTYHPNYSSFSIKRRYQNLRLALLTRNAFYNAYIQQTNELPRSQSLDDPTHRVARENLNLMETCEFALPNESRTKIMDYLRRPAGEYDLALNEDLSIVEQKEADVKLPTLVNEPPTTLEQKEADVKLPTLVNEPPTTVEQKEADVKLPTLVNEPPATVAILKQQTQSLQSLDIIMEAIENPELAPPSEQTMVLIGKSLGQTLGKEALTLFNDKKSFPTSTKLPDFKSILFDDVSGQISWASSRIVPATPYKEDKAIPQERTLFKKTWRGVLQTSIEYCRHTKYSPWTFTRTYKNIRLGFLAFDAFYDAYRNEVKSLPHAKYWDAPTDSIKNDFIIKIDACIEDNPIEKRSIIMDYLRRPASPYGLTLNEDFSIVDNKQAGHPEL
jgi:hypothetical protein